MPEKESNLCHSSDSNDKEEMSELINTLLTYAVNAFFPKKQETEETMTLYYRLDKTEDDKDANGSVTNFVIDQEKGRYSAITNRYMTNNDFSTYNSDIISFVGTRTPKNSVFDKNMYHNSVCINSGSDFIQAVANYQDDGLGVETTVKSQEFAITAKTGKFSKFKKFVINFYNDRNRLNGFNGRVRTVVLSC